MNIIKIKKCSFTEGAAKDISFKQWCQRVGSVLNASDLKISFEKAGGKMATKDNEKYQAFPQPKAKKK